MPPPGALVIRVYNRQFEREPDGKLRYTEPDDYPEGSRNAAARYREAAHDFMWVAEDEWRAFIPKDPRPGDRIAAPASFALRLFRYHLDPERGLGEGITFGSARAESGTLTFIVEEATPLAVRLRLEGVAGLSQRRPDGKTVSYEPSLLGYVSYDPATRMITRLRLVALGAVTNTPRNVRPGTHPLGIAFELVSQPAMAEKVVPRGGRDNVQQYLRLAVTGR
jgi:hypothetical protein